MNISQKKKWRIVRLSGPDPEAVGAWCIDQGASGTSFEEDDSVLGYFELGDPERDALYSLARTEGFSILGEKDLPQRNWVQECKDVWQPLRIGTFTVHPVLSLENAPTALRGKGELRLIPGFGFGTGHHATTAMVLETLQTISRKRQDNVESALDVGTGSGLLAIGIAELFGVPVVAFDIDYGALENASENVALNNHEDKVLLVCGDISSMSGTFDVITANLYAEVLETIRDALIARLRPGGDLVLSGIASGLIARVRSHFAVSPLVLVSEDCREGWGMLWFRHHA